MTGEVPRIWLERMFVTVDAFFKLILWLNKGGMQKVY